MTSLQTRTAETPGARSFPSILYLAANAALLMHRRDAGGAECSIYLAANAAPLMHRRDAGGAECSIYLAANAAPLR
jgi:hypothetical protein